MSATEGFDRSAARARAALLWEADRNRFGWTVPQKHALLSDLMAALAAIDAVLALHQRQEPEAPSLPVRCGHCAWAWPCPTAAALGVTE